MLTCLSASLGFRDCPFIADLKTGGALNFVRSDWLFFGFNLLVLEKRRGFLL